MWKANTLKCIFKISVKYFVGHTLCDFVAFCDIVIFLETKIRIPPNETSLTQVEKDADG